MKQNKETFLEEVLRAEQMTLTGTMNAEKKAQKIVADAEIKAGNLRQDTVEKLKVETNKLKQKFEQKSQKLKQETIEIANAEASLVKKQTAKKIEKLAERLALEVIECL